MNHGSPPFSSKPERDAGDQRSGCGVEPDVRGRQRADRGAVDVGRGELAAVDEGLALDGRDGGDGAGAVRFLLEVDGGTGGGHDGSFLWGCRAVASGLALTYLDDHKARHNTTNLYEVSKLSTYMYQRKHTPQLQHCVHIIILCLFCQLYFLIFFWSSLFEKSKLVIADTDRALARGALAREFV